MISPSDFERLKNHLVAQRSVNIELVSNSMSPVMPTGTRAVVEPATFDQIRPMDFVVFFSEGILICHAAWEEGFFKAADGQRTLITRGLANPFFDEPVKESQILGRVTSHSITRTRFYWLAIRSRLLLKVGIKPKPFEAFSSKNDVRR